MDSSSSSSRVEETNGDTPVEVGIRPILIRASPAPSNTEVRVRVREVTIDEEKNEVSLSSPASPTSPSSTTTPHEESNERDEKGASESDEDARRVSLSDVELDAMSEDRQSSSFDLSGLRPILKRTGDVQRSQGNEYVDARGKMYSARSYSADAPPPAPKPPPRRLRDLPLAKYIFVVFEVGLLGISAGFINAVSIAGVFNTGITHLTGATTVAAISLVDSSLNTERYGFSFYSGLILFFLAGATLGGIILGDHRRTWKGREALVMACEAVVLWISFLILEFRGDPNFSAYLIGMSCGLQNAATSTLDIVMIKTTHVTGTIVDLGLAIGQLIREGADLHLWKLGIRLPIYLSYFFGGCFGTLAYKRFGYRAFLFPCVFISLASIATFLIAYVRRLRRPIKLRKREVEKSVPRDSFESNVSLDEISSFSVRERRAEDSKSHPSQMDLLYWDRDKDGAATSVSDDASEFDTKWSLSAFLVADREFGLEYLSLLSRASDEDIAREFRRAVEDLTLGFD